MRIPTLLFLILAILWLISSRSLKKSNYSNLTFTCIDFRFIFFSRGTILIITASHVSHVTWNVLSTNWVNRPKAFDYKSGSYPSKLCGEISLAFRSLVEAFKNIIICLDSLLLLLDGLPKVKAEYIMV